MFYYNVFLKDGRKVTSKPTNFNLIKEMKDGLVDLEFRNSGKVTRIVNLLVTESEIAAVEVLECEEGSEK